VVGDFADFVDDLRLVDHHAHAPFRRDGSEERFQNALNEASTARLANPAAGYDSQIGFAIRRWCAPVLDLPAHVPAPEYWSRRRDLGEAEVTRRLTRAAGVSDWLLDSGFAPDDVLTPAEMTSASAASAHEVLRLEAVAETVITSIDDPAGYADAFRSAIDARRDDVLAAKSIIAYRAGFDHDLSRPDDAAVARAAAGWHNRIEPGTAARLDDPALLVFGMHVALEYRLPLQLHVGLGDRDLDLRRVNPLHLIDFLRNSESSGVPVALLHCYPFHREAGYLAQAFENVYLDVGLAVNFLGTRSVSLVASSLELAPFGKVLYSSDAFGLAEFHYLGARLWRTAMTSVLGSWVTNGDWSDLDARRVARLIGRDNACRVYRLA
jgi:uncharacterized protein